MSEIEQSNKVEVKVGRWDSLGTHLGEILRFTAEEVGSWTDYAEARSQDDRGTTYTLYRLPGEPGEATYRVHVERWSRWQGEEPEAWLSPTRWAEPHEGGEQANTGEAGSYTEEEARRRQREHGGTAPGRNKTLPQKIAEVSEDETLSQKVEQAEQVLEAEKPPQKIAGVSGEARERAAGPLGAQFT